MTFDFPKVGPGNFFEKFRGNHGIGIFLEKFDSHGDGFRPGIIKVIKPFLDGAAVIGRGIENNSAEFQSPVNIHVNNNLSSHHGQV
jgi:hypothetical protein